LLSDFQKYGSNVFNAFILFYDPSFQNERVRKKKEHDIICSISKKLCYNYLEKQNPEYKSYMYKEQIFLTINELRLFINKTENQNYSETHFRRLFISKLGPFSKKLTLIKKRSQTDIFLINDKYFYGWRDVVENKLAKNKRQVFYRLNSSNWPNFSYAKQTKKRVGFKDLSQGFFIQGQFYLTARAVVEAKLAKDIYQVYYRVRSKSELWKNWIIKTKAKKS